MQLSEKEESYKPRRVEKEHNDDWDIDKTLESCPCSRLPASGHMKIIKLTILSSSSWICITKGWTLFQIQWSLVFF